MTRVSPPSRPAELTSTKTVPMDSDLRVTADYSASRPPLTASTPSGDPNSTKVVSQMFLEPATIDMSTGMSAGLAGAALPEVEGYALIRRIGHGGMGVVFEGVQHATGRRVAMKFMLDGAMNADAARKRFEREVEVVAGLQHPGIVSVIDSGVRKGRYFYVMEYVEGRPLDEALPPGVCPVRQAMELLAKICDAVDYAHQRGVLHRDLKPSNVIIDGAGEPHLLDFGLAKRFNEGGAPSSTLHGRFGVTIAEPGQLVGTVAYMSPEQSLGKNSEMGVRSDIYALGVIAYELITGKLPVEMDGSIREVLARIAEKDPARPSLIRAGVGRDLDAVLLKALDKSPARRYATVGEFAEDLRRYLAGMPVTARNVGSLGRAWRWVRRNEALSSVIAAAVVILVGVSAVALHRIIQERDRANLKADEAEKALAKSRSDEILAKGNYEAMKGMWDSADPEKALKPIEISDLLDGAIERLNKNPPESDRTEAAVRELIGSVYRKFDQFPKALENLSKARQIRERHPEDVAELANCLHNLAALYWWDGRYDTAEPLYQRSLSLRRGIYPGDHVDIATSLSHLAACRLRQARIDDARDLYTQAYEMRRRLYKTDTEEIAQALNNLAKAHLEAENYAEAEKLSRQAVEVIVKVKSERYAGTASARQNLATVLLERGDAAGAKEEYQKALKIRTDFFPKGHYAVATSMAGVAQAELALGNSAEALRLAGDARSMYEARNRTRHVEYAECLQVLGLAAQSTGDAAGAEGVMREALRIAEIVKPPARLKVGQIKGDLGILLAARGDPAKTAEAASLLKESVDLIRAERKDGSRLTASAAARFVEFCVHAGRPADADPYRALASTPAPK